MKKIIKKLNILILVAIISVTGVACGTNSQKPKEVKPKLSQMKAIGQLATIECYYHNMAKYEEYNPGTFFGLIGKVDKHFWIEYSGIVKMGVDMNKLSVHVNGEKVKITMPRAELIECNLDPKSLNEDSYTVAGDSDEIKHEEQTEAVALAQSDMKKKASSDETLIQNAQDRAQKLLEDYVQNLGKFTGKSYTIEWEIIDTTEEKKEENWNQIIRKK